MKSSFMLSLSIGFHCATNQLVIHISIALAWDHDIRPSDKYYQDDSEES